MCFHYQLKIVPFHGVCWQQLTLEEHKTVVWLILRSSNAGITVAYETRHLVLQVLLFRVHVAIFCSPRRLTTEGEKQMNDNDFSWTKTQQTVCIPLLTRFFLWSTSLESERGWRRHLDISFHHVCHREKKRSENTKVHTCCSCEFSYFFSPVPMQLPALSSSYRSFVFRSFRWSSLCRSFPLFSTILHWP